MKSTQLLDLAFVKVATTNTPVNPLGRCLQSALADVAAHPYKRLMMGPADGGNTAHFWTEDMTGKIYDKAKDTVPADYPYLGRGVDPQAIIKELQELGSIKSAAIPQSVLLEAAKRYKHDYSKYVSSTPEDGGQYYTLNLPIGVQHPAVGTRIKLNGVTVEVNDVRTPDDIAKGRGGPVANSMRQNGIAYKVNCLPVK